MDNPLASAPAELLETCLVVEDDSIIRLDLEETLRGFGFKCVIGAATLEAAAGLASARGFGFAVLDFELGRDNAIPIAELLAQRGVAALFLSAHGERIELPPALCHLQVIAKPFSSAVLAHAIAKAFTSAGQTSAKDICCLYGTG